MTYDEHCSVENSASERRSWMDLWAHLRPYSNKERDEVLNSNEAREKDQESQKATHNLFGFKNPKAMARKNKKKRLKKRKLEKNNHVGVTSNHVNHVGVTNNHVGVTNNHAGVTNNQVGVSTTSSTTTLDSTRDLESLFSEIATSIFLIYGY